MDGDSGLSITANLAGLVTFTFAVLGATWLRMKQLRGFERDLERFQDLYYWWLYLIQADVER